MWGVRWLLISIHIFKIFFAVFSLRNVINATVHLTPFLEQNSWQPLVRPWNEGVREGRAQPGEGVWTGLYFLPFFENIKKLSLKKKKENIKKQRGGENTEGVDDIRFPAGLLLRHPTLLLGPCISAPSGSCLAGEEGAGASDGISCRDPPEPP